MSLYKLKLMKWGLCEHVDSFEGYKYTMEQSKDNTKIIYWPKNI